MHSVPSTDDEAINLLSLDGGGVRGVASLVILDGIMRKIKEMYKLPEVPKPCEFFHMIAGTSTGGLIAIMLGRLRMSTKEALAEYDNCAAKIFSKDNHKSWSISEKFRATALEEAIQGLVKKRGLGESMRDPKRPKKGKAFVCVMPSDNIGKTDIVRSFDGDEGALDNWDEDVKIWEAARATTAASSFFKPQRLGKGASARTYIDAAIGVNNPVSILLPEAVKEFGAGRRFGCVVSIGTGTRDVKLERSVGGFESILKFRGVVYFVHLINTLKNQATDAEEAHRQLESQLLSSPGTYYRFNVPDAAAQVKLHHYLKIPELKSMAEEYLSSQPVAKQVRQIAKALQTDDFGHGLTLGHLHDLDKDQILLSSKKIRSMRATSSFFTGRQEILQKLDTFFAPRDTRGSPRREFLLHGMGGVGKTEIAFKVAEAFEDRFEYIFYVDGSTPATVLQSYASIAKQHGRPGVLTEELCAEAMRWMERLSDEWLMIFDDCNLDDRKGHLPGRGKGNIIYTSRRTSLNQDLPVDCTYEVTPFEEADAIELLLKASGLPPASENPQDGTLAEAIVRELECLPLAVEQAAAYIRDGEHPLQEYLEMLRAQKVRILSDSHPEADEEDIENSAVHAALELSYQAIAARRRREGRSNAGLTANLALKVLSLLTFFHHKEFPSLLMKRAAEEHHAAGALRYFPLSHIMSPYDHDLDRMVRVKEDGRWDSGDFAMGVTILRKFSLVKLSPNKKSLSMHVLVHRWARKRIDRDIALRWALVARVLLLESLDPSARLGYLHFSRDLLPHFEVCFAVNPPLHLIRDQYRAHLLHKLGGYYRNQKRFLEAKECFTQSRRLWNIEVGADCWAAITATVSLARLHHEMGNLSEAESVYLDAIGWLSGKLEYRRAVIKIEREGEPEAVRRFSKAYAKWAARSLARKLSKPPSDGIRWSVPLPVREQPSKKKKKKKKPKRPSEADMSNDDILDRTWLRRAEHLDELEMIDTIDNLVHAELAMVYMDQDRYGMGKRMLLRAVEFLEQQLDKYDPDLMKLQIKARTLTHAGDREFWENHMDDVLRAPQEATTSFWQSEASFDLMIAAAYSLLMRDPDDWRIACRELFELYDTGVKWFGGYDRKILNILRYIVKCLIAGGKYDTAVSMANICLRRARSTYGELHMETIRSYATLVSAVFNQKMEFDEEGRELLQGAINKARAGLGSTHSLTQMLEKHLKEFSKKVEVSVEPTSEGLDLEAALMESWRQSKAHLEREKGRLGEQHPIIKRMELVVGDGPVRTKEEMLERVRAGYGPHNSLTKRLEKEVEETRRAALAQVPEMNGKRRSLEASSSNAPRGDGNESSGEALRQPLGFMNEMTRARHTAIGSGDSAFKRSGSRTADHLALEGRIRDIIMDEPGGGVVSIDDKASDDLMKFWMSGALQPILVV